jgi:hypothetical protein
MKIHLDSRSLQQENQIPLNETPKERLSKCLPAKKESTGEFIKIANAGQQEDTNRSSTMRKKKFLSQAQALNLVISTIVILLSSREISLFSCLSYQNTFVMSHICQRASIFRLGHKSIKCCCLCVLDTEKERKIIIMLLYMSARSTRSIIGL